MGSQRSDRGPGGLISMGARTYNPTTGRFLQTDPIPGGNPNPYTYPTDPINQQDLDGECNKANPRCLRRILRNSREALPPGFMAWSHARNKGVGYAVSEEGTRFRRYQTGGDHCSDPIRPDPGMFPLACDTHDLA